MNFTFDCRAGAGAAFWTGREAVRSCSPRRHEILPLNPSNGTFSQQNLVKKMSKIFVNALINLWNHLDLYFVDILTLKVRRLA